MVENKAKESVNSLHMYDFVKPYDDRVRITERFNRKLKELKYCKGEVELNSIQTNIPFLECNLANENVEIKNMLLMNKEPYGEQMQFFNPFLTKVKDYDFVLFLKDIEQFDFNISKDFYKERDDFEQKLNSSEDDNEKYDFENNLYENLNSFRLICIDFIKKQQDKEDLCNEAKISFAFNSVPELMGYIIDTLSAYYTSSNVSSFTSFCLSLKEKEKKEKVKENVEQTLLDMLGFENDSFELISFILKKRKKILFEYLNLIEKCAINEFKEVKNLYQSIQNFNQNNLMKNVKIRSESSIKLERSLRKREKQKKIYTNALKNGQIQNASDILFSLGFDSLDDNFFVNSLLKSNYKNEENDQKTKNLPFFQDIRNQMHNINSDNMKGLGLKVMMPEGTKRTLGKNFEEIFIPPPLKKEIQENKLIDINESLPQWCRLAFSGLDKFNFIQSTIFNAAFHSNKNLLVSAPTGSGKTNIALLAILQQIGLHMNESTHQVKAAKFFKIIYVAPMKSLVGEIVAKYSKMLMPLGINVSELTGDVSLTSSEMNEMHIIVTVPEKLDIITRTYSITLGASAQTNFSGNTSTAHKSHEVETTNFIGVIKCLILDEIHIINEERGAILEVIVARYLRHMERTQQMQRIVGISATLPNWYDVALFLRVEPEMTFYFGNEYRPVPLEQYFIGVTEKDSNRRNLILAEICYEKMLKSVMEGNQCMVFVQSRNETFNTVNSLIQLAMKKGNLAYFTTQQENNIPEQSALEASVMKSRCTHLRDVYKYGFGIHHAGMLRSDRNLTEKLFSSGLIRVLCCTSTLAWGVNFPARTVIIKGTTIFDSKAGGYNELSILDVMQIFGRAGRPQFDKKGTAILITEHKNLYNYLRSLTNNSPIESQLLSFLPDALNAEIAIGNILCEADALDWIRYTYFFVRMFRCPQIYGIKPEEIRDDVDLSKKCCQIINDALEKLNDVHLVRLSKRCLSYNTTDLGRIACRFYLEYETAGLFKNNLFSNMSDSEIFCLFGKANEFRNIIVREEELDELEAIASNKLVCRIPLKEGFESTTGKISLLLQAFLSRININNFALLADLNYIQANASRLMRAMYEISICECIDMCDVCERLLEWHKSLERRIWPFDSILRHFCYSTSLIDSYSHYRSYKNSSKDSSHASLKLELVHRLERKNISYEKLIDMHTDEISCLAGVKDTKCIYKYLRVIPNLVIQAFIQPITSSIVRINLSIKLSEECIWIDSWNRTFEPFKIWLINPYSQCILHNEDFILQKKDRKETKNVIFVVPLQEPQIEQYIILIISDRWVGVSFTHEFSTRHFFLSDRKISHTALLDLDPLPTHTLQDKKYFKLYNFDYFNPIQTQVFHVCYHTDYNILLGAPTGSGKTIIAEIAMFRLFEKCPKFKVVYIAPLKALAKERFEDWQERLGVKLGKNVVELTGDITPDILLVNAADVVITTPEKWDGVSRNWRSRKYVQSVGLLIIDEIHLLGQERGAILEVIVSRMRYISAYKDNDIRFIGLSTALANAYDIAEWMGIGKVGLYNFKPSTRPVPCTVHISGFGEKHYCPRMATMNKPAYNAIKEYSNNKPTLIFVSSRRQTRLTAEDLIRLLYSDVVIDSFDGSDNDLLLKENRETKKLGSPSDSFRHSFLNFKPEELEDFHLTLKNIQDKCLQHCLIHGIGIHHAGLKEADRKIVEHFFFNNKISVLVTTSTLAWGVNLPAHLVIIKGTEYYDAQQKKYVDYPVTDILQMIGRAGRPQFDTHAVACVFVSEGKKNFYKKFLYEPFPVESNLLNILTDTLNSEIAAETINSMNTAIDYLTWTYFFRRLTANPTYYDSDFLKEIETYKCKNEEAKKNRIATFVKNIISDSFYKLMQANCIKMREAIEEELSEGTSHVFEVSNLGRIASLYYVSYKTIKYFYDVFKYKDNLNKEAHCKSLNFYDILQIFSNSSEFYSLPVRHNEDKYNERLADIITNLTNIKMLTTEKTIKGEKENQNLYYSNNSDMETSALNFDSPYTKTYLLLLAHMFDIEMPIVDYNTDLKSVLEQSLRLIQAMLDVCAEEMQLSYSLNVILMLQCLMQGTHPARNSLYNLPYVNDRHIKILRKQKILSLPHLIEQKTSVQDALLQSLVDITESNRKNLRGVLRGVPRLTISCTFKKKITANLSMLPNENNEVSETKSINVKENSEWEEVAVDPSEKYCGVLKLKKNEKIDISVNLKYDNIETVKVFAPKVPKKKSFSWYVILGDEDFNELVQLRRVQLRFKKGNTHLSFTTPNEEGSRYVLSIFVCNDTYFGIDQQKNFLICIEEENFCF